MKTKLLSVVLLLAFLSLFNQTYAQDFYPLNDGDFWEYMMGDTLRINGEDESFQFSVTREIVGDTLMPNGITYKKIKWESISNSQNNTPWYEYQRKDGSHNVYTFYKNEDYLMLVFDNEGEYTYPSHIPGWNWIKSSIFNGDMILFGKQHKTVYFTLDSSNNVRRFISCLENIGADHYEFNKENYWFYKDSLSGIIKQPRTGILHGAIINNIQYGNLLAIKQKIDWSEFYPLHVGDFWVYYNYEDDLDDDIIRITNDSVMPDGNRYYCRNGQYERIDSLGNIYAWDITKNSAFKILRLSNVVGDTSKSKDIYFTSRKGIDFRLLCESIVMLKFPFYPFIWTQYGRNLGVIHFGCEGSKIISKKLKGAYINGVVYGDTSFSIIAVKDENIPVAAYALEQNFPNPFNPTTNITFQLPKESFVSLVVYNVLGEKVETLLDEYRGIGKHTVTFNAHNLPSGIYFYTLQTNGLTETRKMLLLK